MIYFMILWCVTHALWSAAVMKGLENGESLTNKEMLLGVVCCPFIVFPLIAATLVVFAIEDVKKLIKRFKEEL